MLETSPRADVMYPQCPSSNLILSRCSRKCLLNQINVQFIKKNALTTILSGIGSHLEGLEHRRETRPDLPFQNSTGFCVWTKAGSRRRESKEGS